MSGLDIRRNRVMVDIACNDPDNGLFAGRAEYIQIGYDLIELAARREPAPRFVELGGRIRLAGKTWPIRGSKDWIGNWCWNGYWMDIPVAVEFLSWLHRRNFFDIEQGEERIWNVWKSRAPFDQSTREFLDRVLGKPSSHRGAA